VLKKIENIYIEERNNYLEKNIKQIIKNV